MKIDTLIWLAALGVGGYLLYRWASKTIQTSAPGLQPRLDAGVAAIDAGTYNAQQRRMGFDMMPSYQTPTPTFSDTSMLPWNSPMRTLAGFRR